ncbi:MAG: hypothetical protein AAB610_03395 [Patescibacteria group bacterium]
MQPETTGVKTWQWVVTVIVIIVLIILGYYMFNSKDAAAPSTIDDANGDAMIAGKDVNRVVVTDQFPGNIVYLSSVQLTKPGFVVIHKDNAGVPGDVIGYQYFDKGINPGKITLNAATTDGGIYYAVLYSDDGDRVFSATKDLPLKDASKNTIMKLFRVTTTITETKG